MTVDTGVRTTLGEELVSCRDYFSHAEGKNSLVNCLSNFCSVRFRNWWHNDFKNVLCDVTQSLKLRKSSKETACCRDYPSRTFRTPRNKDSQNMKPLSTSDSPCQFSSSETHTTRSQKSWHSFTGRSPVLQGLVSYIALQLPSHLQLLYVTSFAWSNLIGVPQTWHSEQKLNKQLTRLLFPSACEK